MILNDENPNIISLQKIRDLKTKGVHTYKAMKLSLELSLKSYARLKHISKTLGSTDDLETVRRALKLIDLASQVQTNNKIIVLTPDNELVTIDI